MFKLPSFFPFIACIGSVNVFDVAGKEGQLDKCLPTDQLRVMLKNQLEYYFSQ